MENTKTQGQNPPKTHYINKDGDIYTHEDLSRMKFTGGNNRFLTTDEFMSRILGIDKKAGAWQYMEALSKFTGEEMDIVRSVFISADQDKIDSLFKTGKFLVPEGEDAEGKNFEMKEVDKSDNVILSPESLGYKVGDLFASEEIEFKIQAIEDEEVVIHAKKLKREAGKDQWAMNNVVVYTYRKSAFDPDRVLASLSARERNSFKSDPAVVKRSKAIQEKLKNKEKERANQKSLFEVTGKIEASGVGAEKKVTVVAKDIDEALIIRVKKKHPSLKIFQIKRIGTIDILD